MKYSVILILTMMHVLTVKGQSQNPLTDHIIEVNEINTKASHILKRLGQDIGQSISYDSDLLFDRVVNIQSEGMSVEQLLDTLFARDDLKYKFIGNQLVVYKTDEHTIANETCYQFLKGQVLDGLTGLPIPKASVKGLNADLMTVTNEDGKFVLSIPCESRSTEVSIVAPGYHSRLMRDLNTINLGAILMEGSYVTLQEVMILSIPVKTIIESVIDQVSINYMNRATNSRAFFREAILKNNKLSALSEAVFQVYNSSYSSSSARDQVELIKGRRFNDHHYLDSIEFKIKGSLKSCFDLDVIKNPPAFLRIDDTTDQYLYDLRNIVEYDGRLTYVIDFKHRENTAGLPYQGTMYIDKEKLSLLSISFGLNKKNLKAQDFYVLKSSKGSETHFEGADYFVTYTDIDGRLAINYASLKTRFKVKTRGGLFFTKYKTISEYVVNRYQTDDVERIRARDKFITERVFMDEPLNYDPDYWRGVNYLPIDKPLTRVSDRLKHILEE